MSATIEIGIWHEREASLIDRCPSYYAADHETLRTTPGDYPLRLIFQDGYVVPMPYWVLCEIPATRVSGRLYSGFGGVNYGSTELKAGEPCTYTLQTYSYRLRDLLAQRRITLHPGFDWLLAEKPWAEPGAPKDWNAVRAYVKPAAALCCANGAA